MLHRYCFWNRMLRAVVAAAILALGTARAWSATFVVTNTADTGFGSLRAAINAANTTPGADMITFNIPGAGLHVITLKSPVGLTDPVTIDGFTQPGASANTLAAGNNAVLTVQVDGNGVLADGFIVQAGACTLRGMIISRFYSGVHLANAIGGDVVEGCYITGHSSRAVDVDYCPGNRIGGATPAARNVMSGNGSHGIGIRGEPSTGNVIQGNFIGTDFTGKMALPNGGRGVAVSLGGSNTIGGTTPAERNIISGNAENGVEIGNGSTGNVVQGNYIGTDVTGTTAVPNGTHGIEILDPDNTVGGIAAVPGTPPGNVISGNVHYGLRLRAATLVQGNLIGTDATGTADLGNGENGVSVEAPGTVVGGSEPGSLNVISGNGAAGLLVLGSRTTGVVIQGNYIGVDVTGKSGLGNSGAGVFAQGLQTTLGGPSAGQGNVISANGGDGVVLASSQNIVQGNRIGTNAEGTAPLGNTRHGILVGGDCTGNAIGGTGAGAGNTIANNGGVGVALETGAASTSNPILSNGIYASGGLGIDLGINGPTLNDPGDVDGGPNHRQNYPVLNSAVSSGGATTILGTLNSTPNTTFRLEFFGNDACDPSGYGEGQILLGAANVTTNASGNASFTAVLAASLKVGQTVTATATGPAGDTSEFSQCRQALVTANDVSAQVRVTRSGFNYYYATGRFIQRVTLQNVSAAFIVGPVSLALDNLSSNASLYNKTGVTSVLAPLGSPYINVSVGADGVLSPGETATVLLEFTNPTRQGITYAARVLAGPGAR